MDKHILCCISAFIGISYSSGADFSKAIIKKDPLAIPSIRASTTKTLFSFQNDQQKKDLNQKLIKNEDSIREALRFEDLIVEHLDLSEMHLQHIDFSGGTFINVKFNGSDLTGAIFNKTKLDKVNLTGAILCPLDDLGHPILDKTFTLTSGDHYQLFNQYSELMKQSKADQAQCLNKLFPALHLNLSHKNLQGFNLTDINLENANLLSASLKGAILSKNVTVPDYPEYDCSKLFKLWCSEDPEYQQAYQKLVNAGFNIIKGVDHNTLIEGIKKKKNLRNANLYNANLQGADFTNTNLQNANLYDVNLQGANLTNTNLQNANLYDTNLKKANLTGANLQNIKLSWIPLQEANLTNANLQNADLSWSQLQGANLTNANLQDVNLSDIQLQGAILSKNVIVPDYPENDRSKLFKLWCSEDPEYQQAYQELANAQFNLTRGVDHDTLIEGIKKKKDLRNANLYNAQLQGADLTNANLQNADLSWSQLQRADLIGAKLGGAILSRNFKIPKDCKDENLIGIYKDCKDQQAKTILKQILEAKKIPLE